MRGIGLRLERGRLGPSNASCPTRRQALLLELAGAPFGPIDLPRREVLREPHGRRALLTALIEQRRPHCASGPLSVQPLEGCRPFDPWTGAHRPRRGAGDGPPAAAARSAAGDRPNLPVGPFRSVRGPGASGSRPALSRSGRSIDFDPRPVGSRLTRQDLVGIESRIRPKSWVSWRALHPEQEPLARISGRIGRGRSCRSPMSGIGRDGIRSGRTRGGSPGRTPLPVAGGSRIDRNRDRLERRGQSGLARYARLLGTQAATRARSRAVSHDGRRRPAEPRTGMATGPLGVLGRSAGRSDRGGRARVRNGDRQRNRQHAGHDGRRRRLADDGDEVLIVLIPRRQEIDRQRGADGTSRMIVTTSTTSTRSTSAAAAAGRRRSPPRRPAAEHRAPRGARACAGNRPHGDRSDSGADRSSRPRACCALSVRRQTTASRRATSSAVTRRERR